MLPERVLACEVLGRGRPDGYRSSAAWVDRFGQAPVLKQGSLAFPLPAAPGIVADPPRAGGLKSKTPGGVKVCLKTLV